MRLSSTLWPAIASVFLSWSTPEVKFPEIDFWDRACSILSNRDIACVWWNPFEWISNRISCRVEEITFWNHWPDDLYRDVFIDLPHTICTLPVPIQFEYWDIISWTEI